MLLGSGEFSLIGSGVREIVSALGSGVFASVMFCVIAPYTSVFDSTSPIPDLQSRIEATSQ